jgi:hypothetical protein
LSGASVNASTSNSTVTNDGTLNLDNSTLTLANGISSSSGGVVNATNHSNINANGGVFQNQTVTLEDSTLNLNSNPDVLKDSILNVTGTSSVNVKDGKYVDYTIDTLNSDATSRYSIDLFLSAETQKSDTFVLTNGGSGTIYLSSINIGTNIINKRKLCR